MKKRLWLAYYLKKLLQCLYTLLWLPSLAYLIEWIYLNFKHWYAGAFVEFETSRGRIITYESYSTTKDPKDLVTFKAKPGNEIICLKVDLQCLCCRCTEAYVIGRVYWVIVARINDSVVGLDYAIVVGLVYWVIVHRVGRPRLCRCGRPNSADFGTQCYKFWGQLEVAKFRKFWMDYN